jgi:AraC family transcriptional regulator, regulatory protein of adaptative response / methylated-DNA-[protein]-cysteine methyltransferase
MNEYRQMAKVLAYITEFADTQPSLDELANIAGLSPFHFQRKFINWVGISPKSYLQSMTLDKAKLILHQGNSVLDVALASGLSSPGRLHDLCIKLEAATPGEIKSGGEGLVINYGFALTPFGDCLIANSDRGICYLAFTNPDEYEFVLKELKTQWPAAKFNLQKNNIRRLVEKIFTPDKLNKKNTLRGYVSCTRFQIKVWRALIEVPEGNTISYSELAKNINQPRASRAVGNAVAANPLAYLIPCHRVIRNTGVIGNYRWGQHRKKSIITFETRKNLSS